MSPEFFGCVEVLKLSEQNVTFMELNFYSSYVIDKSSLLFFAKEKKTKKKKEKTSKKF